MLLPREIQEQVALEFDIDPKEVEYLYSSWWKQLSLFLNNIDVNKYKETKVTGMVIPHIGHLVLSTKALDKFNEKLKHKNSDTSI